MISSLPLPDSAGFLKLRADQTLPDRGGAAPMGVAWVNDMETTIISGM